MSEVETEAESYPMRVEEKQRVPISSIELLEQNFVSDDVELIQRKPVLPTKR